MGNWGQPICGFSVMRLQGTTSKSHIVKNEIILKVLQFILKSVDKVELFKRLFTMPSVYDYELSNNFKLKIFCSSEWTMKTNFNYFHLKKRIRLSNRWLFKILSLLLDQTISNPDIPPSLVQSLSNEFAYQTRHKVISKCLYRYSKTIKTAFIR